MGRNRNPQDVERLMRGGQQAFRAELATRSEQTAQRLATAYQSTLDTLNPYLRALINLANSDAIGLTRDLYLNQTTRDLQNALREGLDDFARLLDQQSGYMQSSGVAAGRRFGLNSLDAVGGATGWNRPTVETIQALVNYVDSPTFNGIIANFGEYYSNYVGNIILADASLGKNPLFTARHIRSVVQNMPIADANRIARTVQIYSARRGTQAIYQANRGNMLGWYWSSARDKRTCPSCWAMHGKEFSVDELLNDHHMGRCAMIPIPRPPAGLPRMQSPQTGEQYFNQLDDATQRSILGPAKYQAWKNGEFAFDDLTTTYNDPLYGSMRRERTLQELVGRGRARELVGEIRNPTGRRNQPFADILARDENSIRGQSFETGIGYDRNGRRVFRLDGSTDRVVIPINQWEAIRGGTLTHNHPHPTPPSDADIVRAHQYNLREMRAVGVNRSPVNYVIRPPQNGWASVDINAFQRDYDTLYAEGLTREMNNWYAQNNRAPNEAELVRINIRFQSQVIRELSNRYGFEYTIQTAGIRR